MYVRSAYVRELYIHEHLPHPRLLRPPTHVLVQLRPMALVHALPEQLARRPAVEKACVPRPLEAPCGMSTGANPRRSEGFDRLLPLEMRRLPLGVGVEVDPATAHAGNIS